MIWTVLTLSLLSLSLFVERSWSNYQHRQNIQQLLDSYEGERTALIKLMSEQQNKLLAHNWQEFMYVQQSTQEPDRPSGVFSTDSEYSDEYDETEEQVLIDLGKDFEELGITQ